MKKIIPRLTGNLLFGLFMGLFFAVYLTIASGIIYGIIAGVLGGFASGLIFGLLTSLFMKWQSRKFNLIRKELAEKYEIIYDDAANHFMEKEAVGGWLFLTDKGLFFKPHEFNLQKHELWILYKKIKSLSTYKNLGIIENGLLIEKNDGSKNRFVLNDPRAWVEKVEPFIKR